MPLPALLLIAAALVPGALDLDVAEPLAIAALVVILLEGGMDVDLRGAYAPVLTLGILGTFVTAGVVALAAHTLLGTTWTTAGLLGAALAPTDPAMVFATLRGRPLPGRLRTLLEGEAGLNDPAGIALMLGMIELATHADATFAVVVTTFLAQMGIGAVAGLLGGHLLKRVPWLLLLPGAAGLYLATAALGGSGFLAVFVAGFALDKRRVGAAVAEPAVFVVLGATVATAHLPILDGLVLAAVLALVARPAAVLLAPLRATERRFVVVCGLKGAVPILLALLAAQHGLTQIYGTVFVAVAVNVALQGAAVSRLDVPAER